MDSKPEKLKVLFLCTGNSCRSQMAEGWARHLRSDLLEPYSAGTEPRKVDQLAVRVMNEDGVNIYHQKSKGLDAVGDIAFDYVITLCDSARSNCPIYPGGTVMLHVGFDDPVALAQEARSEQAARKIYRRVRDEIRVFVATMPKSIERMAAGLNAGTDGKNSVDNGG